MPCNISFFGSHEVAIPIIEHLLTIKSINLNCVVSQPDRASGRGKILKPTAISEWALNNNIELLRPNKPDEQLAETLKQKGCDLILVMAYGCILRDYILSLPKLGIYNFHASILPKYRGASPVETAIACGEKESGISFMEIVPKMDAGDVLDIEKVCIELTDFASDVYKKLSQACIKIIDKQIEALINGSVIKVKQNDTEATYTRKIIKQDGQIDFNLTVQEIYNRIQGFHEHVGTFTKFNNIILNIGHCEIYDKNEKFSEPGQILSIDKEKIIVSTQCGTLAIFELQRPNGKMLKINDFINGFQLNIGDIFESNLAEAIISKNPFPYKKILK